MLRTMTVLGDFLRLGALSVSVWACGAQSAVAQASPPAALAGSTQLVVVTTPGWDSTTGELRRFVRDDAGAPWRAVGGPVPIVVGRTGLAWGIGFDSLGDAGEGTAGPRKREGDGRSPAGVFPLGEAFGFAPGDAQRTRLPYLSLAATTECVDDTLSAHYNRVVDRARVPEVDWRSAERMREIPVYRLGVVVDYNGEAARARGSCIFLHIWGGPRSTTAGCTAMEAGALTELVAWLDPAAGPVLVQAPEAAYASLRGGWRLPRLGDAPAPSQNPSPMVETTRVHERLSPGELGGVERAFPGPAGRPVEVRVPESAGSGNADMVIHFHGAAWLPQRAVAMLDEPVVTAVVNLGAGSTGYDRAFSDPAAFDSLLAGVAREAAAAMARPVRTGRLTLVGFSAGHGAIRAILREPRHFDAVDAVLLLDGMHTSYVPDRTVLADGGVLDTTRLASLAAFARAAVRGEKRLVVTHSEIFPGTFASTTETADWLLDALSLRRTPVLRWGPRGMQQLSEVRAGRFELLGFAGNSAPDHVDHLHALPELLARTLGS